MTLDAGALIALQDCLERKEHPLKGHIAGWSRDKVPLQTPSIAWAEYWRGRGANQHFIAQLRRRIRVEPVSQQLGEAAADALREWPRRDDRNTVKHLADAIVMAHASAAENVVYTADLEDLDRFWDHFEGVKALVSATSGEIIRTRQL